MHRYYSKLVNPALAVIAFALMFSTPACAETQARVVALDGHGNRIPGRTVGIWRDSKSREAGNALLGAGVGKTNPDLIIPYFACVVDDETPVAVLETGVISFDVEVISGLHAGCKGNVAREHVLQ